MSTAVPHARIQELLSHESFLRRTLRALLVSEADVEDALQQTYVRLLERPGAVPEHPRSWLARVARNVALTGLRSRRRQADHESAFPESREEGSPAESLARMEALKRVVTAILELEEPYRTVVLLRYSEDLDVAAMAQRLSRTEATVRSQLSRAHELLRRKLDREFGGRERWAVLVLRRSATRLPWVAPAVAGVALTLAGTATFLWWPEPRPSEPLLAVAEQASPVEARESSGMESPAASAAPAARQESGAAGELQRRLPAAELFDRSHYKDYELATFSFVHGLRDDPGLRVTRNDWDIEYQGDMFDSRTITNDRSVMVDLGARKPQELDGITLASLGLSAIDLKERLPVQLEHSYFEWSLDDDTDVACLVFVRELEPLRRCVLDWVATDGTGRAQGSLEDDGEGERLVDTLERLRSEALAFRNTLRAPEVVLQARKDSAGGGETRVFMSGVLERVDETSPVPLVLDGELDRNEPARAYVQGGRIPLDRAFHVTRIVHSGQVLGDTQGRGLFTLVVGGTEIVRSEGKPLEPEDLPQVEFGARGAPGLAAWELPPDRTDIVGRIQLAPTTAVWSGDIRLEPGDEDSTYLAVANASAGEARLVGYFVPRERPRLPDTLPPSGTARAAPDEPTPARLEANLPVLAEPRAVLQARAGAKGGNPNRIDLAGKTSPYVDRVERLPLDLSQPPAMRDESLVHFVGGHVPAGQVFVVTRATWWSTAAGDSNGHGEFKLVVAGKLLAERRDAAEPESGAWAGLLRIRPGRESNTYLEIANSSAADVLLLGYFEPLEK